MNKQNIRLTNICRTQMRSDHPLIFPRAAYIHITLRLEKYSNGRESRPSLNRARATASTMIFRPELVLSTGTSTQSAAARAAYHRVYPADVFPPSDKLQWSPPSVLPLAGPRLAMVVGGQRRGNRSPGYALDPRRATVRPNSEPLFQTGRLGYRP